MYILSKCDCMIPKAKNILENSSNFAILHNLSTEKSIHLTSFFKAIKNC